MSYQQPPDDDSESTGPTPTASQLLTHWAAWRAAHPGERRYRVPTTVEAPTKDPQ